MSKMLLIALLSTPLAACDGQVDADHQGTALAKLSGTIQNPRALAIDGAEIVAGWVNSSGDPDIAAVEPVEVTGSFPARFTLSIYTPPPAALLNDDGTGVKFGVATIIAARPGTDYSADIDKNGDLLGVEINHLLIYLPADVPAGSNASYLLHGTPKAGFHLYGVGRLSELEAGTRSDCIGELAAERNHESEPTIAEIFDRCGGFSSFDEFVPLDTDLQTPLEMELTDTPSEIDFPNWT